MKSKENKVTIASAFPDHYEIYEDGSMKAWCKRCNNPEELDADRAAKVQKIPDWSSSFTCTPCWKETQKPHKAKDRDDYVKGAEWGMAYNLAFQKALKDYDMALPPFLEQVEHLQGEILNHIKELKQKTLNQ